MFSGLKSSRRLQSLVYLFTPNITDSIFICVFGVHCPPGLLRLHLWGYVRSDVSLSWLDTCTILITFDVDWEWRRACPTSTSWLRTLFLWLRFDRPWRERPCWTIPVSWEVTEKSATPGQSVVRQLADATKSTSIVPANWPHQRFQLSPQYHHHHSFTYPPLRPSLTRELEIDISPFLP